MLPDKKARGPSARLRWPPRADYRRLVLVLIALCCFPIQAHQRSEHLCVLLTAGIFFAVESLRVRCVAMLWNKRIVRGTSRCEGDALKHATINQREPGRALDLRVADSRAPVAA